MILRAGWLLLSFAFPATLVRADGLAIFNTPRVEPPIVQPGQSATYVVGTVNCGWIGTPSVSRSGSRIDIAILYQVACGLPYAGDDLHVDLGVLPPGAYAVRLLPCEGVDAGSCIPAEPLPAVELRVAASAAAPVPAPAFGFAAGAISSVLLLMLGLFGLRRRPMRR
jgi:hypothetical protein